MCLASSRHSEHNGGPHPMAPKEAKALGLGLSGQRGAVTMWLGRALFWLGRQACPAGHCLGEASTVTVS